jgi:hypothetical protein
MKTILAIALAIVTSANAEKIVLTLKSGGTMTCTLISKSATEIKVETAYGIIPLRVDAVTPESWAAAHRAPPSKPSGKYIVPNPSPHAPHSPKAPQPVPKIEKRESAFSVDDIKQAYAANPVAADLKFKDKQIAVKGTISDIGTDFLGAPFVTLGQKVIKVYSKGSEKQITHLKIGQTTTLTGNCCGLSLGLLLIRE